MVKHQLRHIIPLGFLCSIGLLFLTNETKAQEQPPRPVSIMLYQNLSFGTTIQGAIGGTVIVDPDGTRSVTGDLIEINQGLTHYPAIFELDANPGTLMSILLGSDVVLTGSNGGSISLHLQGTDPVSPFICTAQPPELTQIRIGGILTIGTPLANPAGDYSGYFSVTFIQE